MIIKNTSTKVRKPRKPALSPTKINTFTTCRLMYYFTYIQRISRFYYKPKMQHSFGLSLHRSLEDFHKTGGAQTQSAQDLVKKLHTSWSSLGYESTKQEEQHIEAATQLLEQYHTACQIEGAKTLFTEKTFKQDMGAFNLTGRVDRIDEHPDGCLEIIDYKSGRASVDEDEVRNDPAMGIYAYLAHKSFPEQAITASIYCLRTGDKATAKYEHCDFVEIEDGVRTVADELLAIDVDTEIDPVWLDYVCPRCDYLRLCARRMRWNTDLDRA